MIKNRKNRSYLIIIAKFTLILTIIKELSAAGTCKVNLDCHKFNTCINQTCIHKGFFPITFEEFSGLLLLFLSSLLANASGIGGGGLYVPILIMFNHFDFKDSIPISKIMIFSGALTSFIYNIKYNTHPERHFGPQLDVTLITYMMPFIVLGTQIGIAVNVILPEIILLVLMVLVLIFSTVKTTLNSISKYKSETEEINKNNSASLEKELITENYNTSINTDSFSSDSKCSNNLKEKISSQSIFESNKTENTKACTNTAYDFINKNLLKKENFMKNVELSLDNNYKHKKDINKIKVEGKNNNSDDSDDSLEDPEETLLLSNKTAWR
jgi:hypothetical protein